MDYTGIIDWQSLLAYLVKFTVSLSEQHQCFRCVQEFLQARHMSQTWQLSINNSYKAHQCSSLYIMEQTYFEELFLLCHSPVSLHCISYPPQEEGSLLERHLLIPAHVRQVVNTFYRSISQLHIRYTTHNNYNHHNYIIRTSVLKRLTL